MVAAGNPVGYVCGVVLLEMPEELRPLVYATRRADVLNVRHDSDATLGHLVQSVGVPLTEVGALYHAGGTQLEASYRPSPCEVVRIESVRRPQPLDDPRFLLDVHLGTLARRLRLVGLDAAYRNDATDDELLAQARQERRVLLTQDRGLLQRRALICGAYVRGQWPDDQLRDVLDRFALALQPFTRCPTCAAPLRSAPREEVFDQLQPGTQRTAHHFTRCTSCGRVYWHGAHSRRLDALVRTALAATSDHR